jgi:multicomponent Na+:H+ antiporter subunit C
MTILYALGIAVLFGTGAYMMLKRDLIRLIAGMMLIGNAANLFIMAVGLRRGGTPILPAEDPVSDPLVQAMVLTAIVISFAVGALALALVFRVYGSHASVDLSRIAAAEEEQSEAEETARTELDNEIEDDTDGAERLEPEGEVVTA